MGIKIKALISLTALFLSVPSFAADSNTLRLVDAVKKQDQQAVRSLLEAHADVNSPAADGATALSWAAHWNDLETADLLIRAGANVNAMNDYGVTALWEACNNGSAALVEKLAQAGADPNAARASHWRDGADEVRGDRQRRRREIADRSRSRRKHQGTSKRTDSLDVGH